MPLPNTTTVGRRRSRAQVETDRLAAYADGHPDATIAAHTETLAVRAEDPHLRGVAAAEGATPPSATVRRPRRRNEPRLPPMRRYDFDSPTHGVFELALYDQRIRTETYRHLWRMTTEERIAAMWRGDLSLAECLQWSSRYPDEVPRIGTEFAYIVMHTPEWLGEAA
jgi:hypothetical protein